MDENGRTSKLIWRTAFITLFAFVMVLMLSFNIIGLAAPGLIADGANRLGLGGVAVSFSKGQYERSGSIDDLGTLCERAIRFGKDAVANEYLEELVAFDRDGESLATLSERRSISVDGKAFAYEAYILGNRAAVLYRCGEPGGALAFAEERSTVYFARCPLAYLVDAYLADAGRAAGYGLVSALEAREEKASGAEERELLIDLVRVHSALGNGERAAAYRAQLESLLGG